MEKSRLFTQCMGRWLMSLLLVMLTSLAARALEGYTCYTSSNTTLTFYYDDYRSSRSGQTYSLNTGANSPVWVTNGINASVTRVVFNSSFADARPRTTYNWFYEMTNLQSITGLEYLNTSAVTNMAGMFNYCSQLKNLNVRGFNTSRVTDMSGMFYECTNLTVLDLTYFNTANVEYMDYMFEYCRNLTTIYASSRWSTESVLSGMYMFYMCELLEGGKGTDYYEWNTDESYAHIDGGSSNPGYFTAGSEAYVCYTSSNTTLKFYYDDRRSSRSGTIYDLNTGSNFPYWNENATNVTRVVFDPSFASARPTSTFYWFYNMKNLTTITGIVEYLNTSEVTRMDYMFEYCEKLTSLDLSYFNTFKVNSMCAMFSECTGLTSLDLSSFNTSQVTNMEYMFSNSTNLQTIYVSSGWSTDAVINSFGMFFNCTSLVGGQGTTFSSSNPKDKTYAHIDGGTSNPGYLSEAYKEAYAVYTPSNTTLTFYYDGDMGSRVGDNYSLHLDGGCIPDYDGEDDVVYNVTKVEFDPSFADARPAKTNYWFNEMYNLEKIYGLEYLNTSNVTNMGNMFSGCSSLTSLDLSSFNTANVTYMGHMFFGCDNLETIYVGSGWSTNAVTHSDNMFKYCLNIRGQQGTTYNSNYTDKTYARVDGAPSKPGYLSEKREAYAVYMSTDKTLTFYYDDLRNTREGTTYDLNNIRVDPEWSHDATVRDNIKEVVFDPSFAQARPDNTYGWFFGMQNLEAIKGIYNLNTSEVTSMYAMFLYCSKLTGLDLSHFNTANVTDMSYMFYNCSNLTTIYVGSGWSTASLTASVYMFSNCPNLEGSKGTVYDSNHIDAAYAHIDGGSSNPGYLSSLRSGDVTIDGVVNVADVTELIRIVLHRGSYSYEIADVNGDGTLNVADVTALIQMVLNN